jgi:hypothetical protein
VTVATDLGVPRSTARGWLAETATVVVCLDVTELTEPELRQISEECCQEGNLIFPGKVHLLSTAFAHDFHHAAAPIVATSGELCWAKAAR